MGGLINETAEEETVSRAGRTRRPIYLPNNLPYNYLLEEVSGGWYAVAGRGAGGSGSGPTQPLFSAPLIGPLSRSRNYLRKRDFASIQRAHAAGVPTHPSHISTFSVAPACSPALGSGAPPPPHLSTHPPTAIRSTADFEAFCTQVGLRGGVYRVHMHARHGGVSWRGRGRQPIRQAATSTAISASVFQPERAKTTSTASPTSTSRDGFGTNFRY
jgi:hypothetical protein